MPQIRQLDYKPNTDTPYKYNGGRWGSKIVVGLKEQKETTHLGSPHAETKRWTANKNQEKIRICSMDGG